ncbi:hypothetical protein PUNSTDRAFT_123068 [Punctularia strigosozonata HHB-11173 SS5]|uniref:Mid2 domain-containing protein n=1 Tax=Punctularia strigosozonata (strain HHB-11173) TaxID=741275 RepID=R7S1C4_PUNST|nr:uncharacterized protein PUNSTDRAFT_123068 [Punctularia strigosozonata HHB-11173 SS5]EIN04023.1 hypothetical protein PUNSTDRAFT_123068 [Punctularia strigosozonata HHB-11173 SS5]
MLKYSLRAGPFLFGREAIAILVFWSLLSCISVVRGSFTFSFDAPTECDDLVLSWSGGVAPFTLLLIPLPLQVPINISIPDSAFSNGAGRFSTQLPLAAKTQFLMTLSDSTGFGSGGTTEVLTVGSSISGASCDTTGAKADFTFELDNALQQCRPFTFGNYNDAVQPVHILGIVPGGGHVAKDPPVGPTSFDWVVDAARGTSIVFLMFDSKGRQGGASDVRIVDASDDSTCLDNLAPSSTANPPAESTVSTSTGSAGQNTSTETGQSSPKSGGLSRGAIVGIIIGVVVAVAAAFAAVFVLCCRRRRRGGWNNARRRRTVDLLPNTLGIDNPVSQVYAYPRPTTNTRYSSEGYAANYREYRSNETYDPYNENSTSTGPSLPSSPGHLPNPYGTRSARTSMTPSSVPTTTATSPAQLKAAMAGVRTGPPPLVVLHTDIEDELEEGVVVELPPQYTPSRAPISAERIQSSVVGGVHVPAPPVSPVIESVVRAS